MKSYTIIKIEKPCLWLRFGKIGKYAKFSILLSDFHNTFPSTLWDDERKSWVLSDADFGKVLTFCKKHKLSPILSQNNNTTSNDQGQQFTLPFTF
ncbi:MAG: hypothetical protein Fur0022_39510 [Anaerolineales bacterium]